jgi:hypothetical protein
MNGLTTELLSRACRTFLTLAYPAGEESIPEKKRAFLRLSSETPLDTLLPPAPAARGLCEVLTNEDGSLRGYAFRLGSATFPHLKLQVVDYKQGTALVFAVDTHDAFPRSGANAVDHPDFERWTAMQKANRQLKQRVERAWEQEGLWTFPRLLRLDTGDPGPLRPGPNS